ncbi:Maturin, partial [Lamprotornis superbus]
SGGAFPLGQTLLAVGRSAGRVTGKRHLATGFHVWSESEDCLPFLQLAQDYISSCGKKTLHEILEKVFKSFRPLLGLPDVDDDAFEEYNADVEEEEPEADHQQMGVSQQIFWVMESPVMLLWHVSMNSRGASKGRQQEWTLNNLAVIRENWTPQSLGKGTGFQQGVETWAVVKYRGKVISINRQLILL